MTGREKIELAFAQDGTPEIPAVICYEHAYIRDHWNQLTSCPWWYALMPDIEHQMLWRREVFNNIGQDWFRLPGFYSRNDRENISIEVRPEGVFQIDGRTGKEQILKEPKIGGEVDNVENVFPKTSDEVDNLIPIPAEFDTTEIIAGGRNNLACQLLKGFARALYPICAVPSPFTPLYDLFGFEGMMILSATRPDLVKHACQRLLILSIRTVREAAALGAAGIWIEEAFTDMISPKTFESLSIPFLKKLIEEIRSTGLRSIYYFCGNPAGKWEQLLSVGADALALEESKKGFTIDIEDIVAQVQGHCTVLGNLDAVDILQNGSEEQLQTEISRQIAAGQRNGRRFIMSLGSPVTPGTSVERVRRYCNLVREMGIL